jgi:hypothetical protein
MKKIYLSMLALSVCGITFGQYNSEKTIPFRTESKNNTIAKSTTKAPQDKGALIWSDDFSNSATWTFTNSSSPAQNWIHTTNKAAIPAMAGDTVQLTSAANGYVYIDSDDAGGAATQNVTIETVTPINCSTEPAVSLSWEQHYMAYQETFTISVSGDNGANWTDFIYDNGPLVSPQVREYGRKSINISSVAGNATQVLIRFNYIGAWDWFWSIDDVELRVADDNDLVAKNGHIGFGPTFTPYTRIPSTQVSPLHFFMDADNIGAAPQTGTILTADVNSGTFTGTSVAKTINPSASDTFYVSTQYTAATAVGVPNNVTLTISSDSVDSSPADNVATFPAFELTATDGVYAQDEFSATPNNGGGFDNSTTPATEEFEAGNFYDIYANQNVSAIDVFIGSNSVAGTIIDVVLYDVTSGSFVQVDRSTPITLTAGDIGTLMSIALPTNPMLTAGSNYFAAVHAFASTGEFFYGVSGNSPDNNSPSSATSLIFYPNMSAPATNQNYFTTSTPMVRLNFAVTGLDELSTGNVDFNVYPNPSNGEFTLNLNSDVNENIALTVKNAVGQDIINKKNYSCRANY